MMFNTADDCADYRKILSGLVQRPDLTESILTTAFQKYLETRPKAYGRNVLVKRYFATFIKEFNKFAADELRYWNQKG